MITKQQALEFIYELSKTYIVIIDLPVRTFKVTHKDGIFHGCSYGQDLEAMVRNFIDVFIRIKKVVKVNFPIPADVDMLEVGQTYKVELDDFYDGCHSVHIAEYTGEEEGYYYFKNRHTWRYEKKDLYQLWKMNNKENGVQ